MAAGWGLSPVVKRANGLIARSRAAPTPSALCTVRWLEIAERALSTARIGPVKVHGDAATAYGIDGWAFASQMVSPSKVASAWRIARVPGLSG
jgi:hypothetical protein